jgi:hypothetical protein
MNRFPVGTQVGDVYADCKLNEYCELYPKIKRIGSMFGQWNETRGPCPSPAPIAIRINDTPSISLWGQERYLCFKITFFSSCDKSICPTESATVYASQYIKPDGMGGVVTHEFKVLDGPCGSLPRPVPPVPPVGMPYGPPGGIPR